MAKKIIKVCVKKLTIEGAYQYGGTNINWGETTFTSSFSTCYFEGNTYKKIKGGQSGGNYSGEHDGEVYRISQH